MEYRYTPKQHEEAVRQVIAVDAVLDDSEFSDLKRAVGKKIEVDFTQDMHAGPESRTYRRSYTATLLDFALVVDAATGKRYLAFLDVDEGEERVSNRLYWFPSTSKTNFVTSRHVKEATTLSWITEIRDKKTKRTLWDGLTSESIDTSNREGYSAKYCIREVALSYKDVQGEGSGVFSKLLGLFRRRD